MNIIIRANVGIGEIVLGATKEQVEEVLDQYAMLPDIGEFIPSMFNSIEYDSDERVKFIEFSNPYHTKVSCLYTEVDIFRTKVDELVEYLDKISPYQRDAPELGYMYTFPQLGMTLWRPTIVTEADLETVSEEMLEEAKEGLYFMTVSLARPGYW